jgi:hypothetical protein
MERHHDRKCEWLQLGDIYLVLTATAACIIPASATNVSINLPIFFINIIQYYNEKDLFIKYSFKEQRSAECVFLILKKWREEIFVCPASLNKRSSAHYKTTYFLSTILRRSTVFMSAT